MPSDQGIFIEIIGDAKSYIRAAFQTIGANKQLSESNTLLSKSYTETGVDANLSADLQLKAAAKASAALKANALALSAGVSKLPLEEQAAGAVAAEAAMAKYNRSIGITTTTTRGFSSASKTAEKDLSETIRGGLAGSGVFSGLGRSLAFASGGFLAVATGAQLIAGSIHAAEDLEKAQNSLGVAIEHTGGNLQKLLPQYEETAKAAAQFGVTQAEATTGLARATVLTGNASAAQRAYQEALVISKATGKDFNAVLTATSKGQEGITTSLRRYGILVDATTSGQDQFTQVMKRFGGQAAANTTSLEKLHAAFDNTLATIGEALLPTVNKLAGSFANWLTKMNESGKLQKDVAAGMKTIHDVAAPLVGTIKDLAGAVGTLNSAWKGLNDVLNKIPGSGAFPSAADFIKGGIHNLTPLGGITDVFHAFSPPAPPPPPPLVKPDAFGLSQQQLFGAPPSTIVGAAQPMKQYWKQFELGFKLQMAGLQAALTKSNKDDVAVAKATVARLKKQIDEGVLHGPALQQALQAEAGALTTIWAAEDAAAQKRAAAAQAAKQKIQAEIQDSIDPLRLEVALSRAQALGKPILAILRKLRASARKALESGKLSLEQQKEAWDQIAQLNQQIADALKKKRKETTDSARQFKQQSTRALTEGLGLTAEQRKALRARLSQRGPGGTVPGDGTGAFGEVIGSNGRPIHIHNHVHLDGKEVANNTTRHQQRRRRRNSSQRRGPNAGG